MWFPPAPSPAPSALFLPLLLPLPLLVLYSVLPPAPSSAFPAFVYRPCLLPFSISTMSTVLRQAQQMQQQQQGLGLYGSGDGIMKAMQGGPGSTRGIALPGAAPPQGYAAGLVFEGCAGGLRNNAATGVWPLSAEKENRRCGSSYYEEEERQQGFGL